jgi:hypothetical protein
LLRTALLAAALGSGASVAGVYLGYHQGISPGGTIVLITTSIFFLAWLLAPRHGIVAGAMARRDRALIRSEPEAVAEVILASPEIRAPHEP